MFFPDREEFRRKAARGNLIPVYKEILADLETPVSAFRKIGRGNYAFLLESVEAGEKIARQTFLGGEPFAIFESRGRRVTIRRDGETETRELGPGDASLTGRGSSHSIENIGDGDLEFVAIILTY